MKIMKARLFVIVALAILTTSVASIFIISHNANSRNIDSENDLFLKNTGLNISPMLKSEIINIVNQEAERKNHIYISFDGKQDKTVKSVLENMGVKYISRIRNDVWIVRILNTITDKEIEGIPLKWVSPIPTTDKLHARLQNGITDSWATDELGNTNVYVLFHDDITPSEAEAVIFESAVPVLYHFISINAIRTVVSQDELTAIAARDEVLWIEPTPPKFIDYNDGVREATYANSAQAPLLDLTGNEVTTLVYECAGLIDYHEDYIGRLIVGEEVAWSEHGHPTHVAGVLGGDGSASNDKYRGMAPEVIMVSYCLYCGTELGENYVDELEADYQDAFNKYAIDIITNSWGSSYAYQAALTGDLSICEFNGEYTIHSQLIDAIACGSLGRSPLIVWGSGNERGYGSCSGYELIGIPATAKNILTVGAINTNDHSMTVFSSWGPTDDGRLKPELVAPGCESNYSNPDVEGSGIWSTYPSINPSTGTKYTSMCGTSMSSPAAAGCAALVLQKYRELYTGQTPLSSTLKAILINSANDLGNPGPDFKFGFGEIDAFRAIEQLVLNTIGEDEIAEDEEDIITFKVYNYNLDYGPGSVGVSPDLLSITVTWNDSPGHPLNPGALMNDLDLFLISPSGTRFDQYTLNPLLPEMHAGTGNQHIDNTRQVRIECPETGDWEMHVKSGEIFMGVVPQSYSFAIMASPPPITLFYPNKEREIASSSTQRISWEFSHYNYDLSEIFEVDHFDIEFHYMYDDGVPRQEIVASVDKNVREYDWIVPEMVNSRNDCYIKIVAYDSEGKCYSDTSDEDFHIYDQKTKWIADGIFIDHAASDAAIIGKSYCIISDGSGGAYISRIGGDPYVGFDLILYKIDHQGNIDWDENVISGSLSNYASKLVPDGSGGVIVFWTDIRNGDEDIHAQRFDMNGVKLWVETGMPIRIQAFTQVILKVISDGVGGAFCISGTKYPTGLKYINCIRIDSSGNEIWVRDNIQLEIKATGDGRMFSTYYNDEDDSRSVRLIDYNGDILWDQHITNSTSSSTNPATFKLISSGDCIIVYWDDSDIRIEHSKCYAQKLDVNGNKLWGENGKVIIEGDYILRNLKCIPDNSNGAIMVWSTGYLDQQSERDLCAQRINSSGVMMWGSGEVEENRCLLRHDFVDFSYNIVSDGCGGVIISWTAYEYEERNIHFQIVPPDGNPFRNYYGFPICTARYDQEFPCIVSDGGTGAIIAWLDDRGYDGNRVYTNRIDEYGAAMAFVEDCYVYSRIIRTGDTAVDTFTLDETYLRGCPLGDEIDVLEVKIAFNPEYVEGLESISPDEFTLNTDELPFSFCNSTGLGEAGTSNNNYIVSLVYDQIKGCSGCNGDGCFEDNSNIYEVPVLYGGIVIGMINDLKVKSVDANNDGFVNISELSKLGDTYNKLLDDPGYNGCFDFNLDSQINLSDFTIFVQHYTHCCDVGLQNYIAQKDESPVTIKFIVEKEEDPEPENVIRVGVYLEYASSIDALCIVLNDDYHSLRFNKWIENPEIPGRTIVAKICEKNELLIGGFGLEGSSGLLKVGTIEYISSSDNGDNSINDQDVFGNGSAILKFGDMLDADGEIKYFANVEYEDGRPVCKDYLGANYPNPFNPSTTIEYSLVNDAHVNLSIYNVNGQLVRTLVDAKMKMDNYRVIWDGKNNRGNNLSSGIYFLRLKTETFTKTQKMVLLR